MAVLENTKFIPFTFPTPLCNSQSLWPAKTGRPIHSLSISSSQKMGRPAATGSRTGCQIETDRNTAAAAQDRERALAINNEEFDDDFPSLEELSQVALHRKILTESSETGSTLQLLGQPALYKAGQHVNRTQSGSGIHQGGSRDQPVILDNDDVDEAGTGDKAIGAFGDIDIGRTDRNPSSRNTFATLELDPAPTKSIDTSGPWYDVEEDRYIVEPAPGIGPRHQQDVPSAPAQVQLQPLSQHTTPQQGQINQQGIQDLTWSTSVEPALHSHPKPSEGGDDRWTDEEIAELDKELGLALEEEQVESLSASASTSSSPRSVKAQQDEVQSREYSENVGSRPEEPRDICRPDNPAQGAEWEQGEIRMVVETLGEWEIGEEDLVGEAGAVEIRQHEEISGQKAELRRLVSGDQRHLAEVDDADDPMDKETTEALPPTQLENGHHRFRLRGIRTRQLPERQTKTTQYQIVWGENPNRSETWVNEDEVQISIPQLPFERSPQYLVPLERDIIRVHQMRCSRRSKGKKIFEYLVDERSVWITEDQLRISLSPTLLVRLQTTSLDPLSRAQSEVHRKHLTPINDEHCNTSRISRSPFAASAPPAPARSSDPDIRKRRGKWGQQAVHEEIGNQTYNSINVDDNHNTCDTDDEDPRPAKRRKPRSVLTSPAPPPRQQHHLHSILLNTSLGIDGNMLPQANRDRSPTSVDDEHCSTPRVSQRSASAISAPDAEYQEWPFEGFLRRTKIGNETVYNIEFRLPYTPEHVRLSPSNDSNATSRDSSSQAVPSASSVKIGRPRKVALAMTKDEEVLLAKMIRNDKTWTEIGKSFPDHSLQSLKENYFGKQRGKPRKRGRKKALVPL